MSDVHDRKHVARAAGKALKAASGRLDDAATLAGFDGCVDSIIRVARRRTAPGPRGYEPMQRMRELAEKIDAASGKSAGFELVVQLVKLGGNGPLMASALHRLGAPVSFIGNIGLATDDDGVADPDRHAFDVHAAGLDRIHPVYRDFARSCRRCFSAAPTGYTDALEFHDGKIMLGKIEALEGVTWRSVTAAAGGAPGLAALIRESRIIATCNWTKLLGMNDIWRGLAEESLPLLNDAHRRFLFVDLADPAGRSDDDLRLGLTRLRAIQQRIPVTLGLNIAESERIANLAGAAASGADNSPQSLERRAASLQSALGLDTVVIHRQRGASAAEQGHAPASFDGPWTATPALSTGAGDNFNAGYAFARALGLPLPQRLAAATAVSGWYVRHGTPPTLDETIAFLEDLPDAEG